MGKKKIKQAVFESLVARLNKSSALSASSSIAETDCELISSGTSKIKSNLSILSERMRGLGTSMMKGYDSYCEGELIMEAKANAIEIPTELKNVFSPYQNQENQFSLSKKDGEAVKTDQDLSTQTINDYAKISEEEKLKDMSDIEELDVKELNDNMNNNLKILYELKDEQLKTSELDNIDGIDEIHLIDSFSDSDVIESKYDDSLPIKQEATLKDINNGETHEVVFEDNLKNLGEIKLDLMKNKSINEQVEYKDNTQNLKGNALEDINIQ